MNFIKEAKDAGFTSEQAEFMMEHLAKFPHTHDIDEVEGLPEVLEDLGAEEDDEDESA